ncbi:MAG TPA: hypothetical protein VHC22_32485 [Pirellulales bacterium]|nr:hypothetical protein [Pirellulales bacterium]
MSMAALLLAMQTVLRDRMPIPDGQPPQNYIGIQPAGQLPRSRGQWYVALDEAGVASTEKVSLSEEYSVEVRIVKQIGQYAPDQLGRVYTDHTPGLDELERAVIRAIHNNHRLRQIACDNAGAPGQASGDVFQSPLWYVGRGRTELGDKSLERRLNFRGARRVQAIDVMQ